MVLGPTPADARGSALAFARAIWATTDEVSIANRRRFRQAKALNYAR